MKNEEGKGVRRYRDDGRGRVFRVKTVSPKIFGV